MCLEMKEIQIPAQSIFIGHGYVQHSGASWDGSRDLRYNMYIILESSELKDAI